jgi:hypothetical protein
MTAPQQGLRLLLIQEKEMELLGRTQRLLI